jgi:hypothetical protein
LTTVAIRQYINVNTWWLPLGYDLVIHHIVYAMSYFDSKIGNFDVLDCMCERDDCCPVDDPTCPIGNCSDDQRGPG